MSTEEYKKCGLLKRLLAILYDSLLLFSLLFLATLLVLPLTHGKAVESNNLLYPLYLLLWAYLYFCWQWVHGGQTLGMRAWRIKLVTNDNKPIRWKQASKRFFLSLLSWGLAGIGFIWALSNKERLTLHDRYSNTKLQIITKSTEQG